MKTGIVVYPGSNCDADCYHVFDQVLNQEVRYVWHTSTELDDLDCVILPGGFSYGDYLRPGAIASHSPIAEALRNFATAGKLILGICNGFQILTELKLLPGALLPNDTSTFICKNVGLSIANCNTAFTRMYDPWECPRMPIAHNEGKYYIDHNGWTDLQNNNQIVFRYVDNPNGSLTGIAGIMNKEGNVLGMMPHPERASEDVLGSTDGLPLFKSMEFHIDG